MNLMILATCNFLHLIATVVWIGGIFMILLVILPGAKASLESGPMISGLMKEISKRFTPMAKISIVVLIITGIVTVLYDIGYLLLKKLYPLKTRWFALSSYYKF